MTAAAVAHVVVSGLATGSIYALVALSLVIVYNATRTVNFAQGEMFMVSTFVAWSVARAGAPLGVALVVAVVSAAALGFVIERLVIRRAIAATHWDVLIITLGVSLVLKAGAGIVWTNDEFPFPSYFGDQPLAIGAVRVAPVSLGIVGASVVLMAALGALLRFTRLGREHFRTRRFFALISVPRVFSAAWMLAAVVGAVAGVLIAPVVFLSTKMGGIVINGFIAAVLGGFGSMPGAILGGMLLGVLENLAPLYLPTGIRYSVPFLVLIAVLLLRPSGLVGRVERRKV